ncbi:MAG: TMEM165/GDT1 family protein [Dongiaceae bacterium]
MEALAVATGVVALAEIGDKTQLLALLLASRYRRPWPIAGGILVATLLNHAGAALIGSWIADWLAGPWLHWIVGLSFLAFAAWALVPDKLEDDKPLLKRGGVFLVTAIAFFFVEIGDKTQFATVALAARYPEMRMVVLGTTLGMMLANLPVVWMGGRIAKRVPLGLMRGLAALVFALLGLWVLIFGIEGGA